MDMFWEDHGALYVFDRQGEQVFSMRGVDSGVVAWSRDGQWLAFDTHNRAVGESMRTCLVIARTSDWQAFQADLAFDRVSLLGWIEPWPLP
jgi:hypothetical protein